MGRVEEIRASAGLERLQADLADLEAKAAESSLWDDPRSAQGILSALTDVKEKIKLLSDFKSQVPYHIGYHCTSVQPSNYLWRQ